MNFIRVVPLFVAGLAVVLASCGGGAGVTLGAFPAISKTEGDAPFALVAPQSSSPGAFSYSSSDPKVATISGNMVTVLLEGTTVITAGQAEVGSYRPTSTTAVLTVAARICTAPTVRDNGMCVLPCTAPATRQNGACVAPAPATGKYVVKNSLTWMPTTLIATWDNAHAFCTGSTINGLTGWRLPTEFELSDLYASGLMNGQQWTLAKTWTSTPQSNPPAGASAAYLTLNLANGAAATDVGSNSAYFSCVR